MMIALCNCTDQRSLVPDCDVVEFARVVSNAYLGKQCNQLQFQVS